MTRQPNNQEKLDQAMRRMVEKGAQQSEPDITRNIVWVNGKPKIIAEKFNEIRDGKTITIYSARLDDSGQAYSHIRDVIVTDCGCQLNIRNNEIVRCFLCHKTLCLHHSVQWHSKDLSFCRKPLSLCWIAGRFYQTLTLVKRLFVFSICNIFGIERQAGNNVDMRDRGDMIDEDNFSDRSNQGNQRIFIGKKGITRPPSLNSKAGFERDDERRVPERKRRIQGRFFRLED